jgi:hypothetical protein
LEDWILAFAIMTKGGESTSPASCGVAYRREAIQARSKLKNRLTSRSTDIYSPLMVAAEKQPD